MNHADTLQGFGMLTAITEPVLNQELASVFQRQLVPTQISRQLAASPLDPGSGASIHLQLAAPTIMILAGSENKQQVALNLNISSGTYVAGGGSTLNIDDWKYSFMVPLGVLSCSPEELQSREDVPRAVKTQVASYPSDKINVKLVYLDFDPNKLDTTNYLKNISSCPFPPSLGGGSLFDPKWNGILADFQTCLYQHFTDKEANNKSYILGYIVTVIDPAKDYISLPLFNPTGCSYATTFNEQDTELNTLNFMIVTNGAPVPTALNTGLYTPWVKEAGEDGCLVVGRELLFDQWLLPKLISGVAWTLTEGDTSKINLQEDQYGWVITYNTDDEWDKNSIHYQQLKTHTIQVRPVLNQTNNALVTLEGQYENQVIFKDALLAKGSMDAKQSWTINIKLDVNQAGQLSTLVSSTIPAPTIQTQQNEAMKILNVLMDGQLEEQMTQVTQDWASHEHELAACLQNELAQSYASKFLLPSGEPIVCSSTQLDEGANLIVAVSVK